MPAVSAVPLLARVVRAAVALTSGSPLPQVLQRLADTARDLIDARQAALAVVDAGTSHLAELATSGPIADLEEHLKCHPVGEDTLVAPIVARDRLFGHLYVTGKADGSSFTDDDRIMLQMLAAMAAAAVENAQLRQERERFFAAASHELGNAVAGVRLWADHLAEKMKEAPAEWIAGLQQVRKGADNAHRLIDDLLSMARIQEGRLKLVPWPVDVSALILDVAGQFAPEMERANLRLDSGWVEPGIVVEADGARVRQIFTNLFSNALKFAPHGTTISIGVQRDGEHVRAWVADQGPGVARADFERIFRPYEQVSGVARGRGTGLGLPLSRQLARLMGGDLWVESEIGFGARFILRL